MKTLYVVFSFPEAEKLNLGAPLMVRRGGKICVLNEHEAKLPPRARFPFDSVPLRRLKEGEWNHNKRIDVRFMDWDDVECEGGTFVPIERSTEAMVLNTCGRPGCRALLPGVA